MIYHSRNTTCSCPKHCLEPRLKLDRNQSTFSDSAEVFACAALSCDIETGFLLAATFKSGLLNAAFAIYAILIREDSTSAREVCHGLAVSPGKSCQSNSYFMEKNLTESSLLPVQFPLLQHCFVEAK